MNIYKGRVEKMKGFEIEVTESENKIGSLTLFLSLQIQVDERNERTSIQRIYHK